MTTDQALAACRQSVAADLARWQRKTRRDTGMPNELRLKATKRIGELKRLLDFIDGRKE